METLLYWILGVQLVIVLFIVMPFGTSVKNSILNFASKQPWITHLKYLWAVIACLVFVSCTAHQNSLLTYTQLIASSDSFVPGYREHQLEAERDRNLSGVIFALMLLLHRTMALMLDNYKVQQSHSALKQQADNQARFASQLLNAEKKDAKKADTPPVAPQKEEQDPEREKMADARRKAEAQMTEKLMGENKRLQEEVEKLKEKLADYITMFDTEDGASKSKKKED